MPHQHLPWQRGQKRKKNIATAATKPYFNITALSCFVLKKLPQKFKKRGRS